jgi:hypothetical protein
MRRKNPLYSLSGMLLTVVFISGLAWSLWDKGGLAFNPGPLTALNRSGMLLNGYRSHADLESECSRCHQPLTSNQTPLCLDCHTTVQDQIRTDEELHGKISTGGSGIPIEKCYACHSDHQGRDFSPAKAALNYFEHDVTVFSLIRHQVDFDASPLDCEACHADWAGSDAEINTKCDSCHATRDQDFMNTHRDEFGTACTDCHDGVDRMVDFDHQQTSFPLTGGHSHVQCTACHVEATNLMRFEGISGRCADCHTEPALHAGLFSSNCEDCHTALAWSPAVLDGAIFDHAAQTRFSLARHLQDYDGIPFSCKSCHTQDLASMPAETCIDCHRNHDTSFMEEHLVQFGGGCLECHDGVDRMRNFDHNLVFPLDGRHAQIECQACHGSPPQPVRYAGTPTACADCHAEPEIHAGVFGLECQNCHHTDAWIPALLQNHSFPLDHGEQGMLACQVCHPTAYVEYTCYGCHEHDPLETLSKHLEEGISEDELPNCTSCHPTGREDEAEED